VLAWLTRVLKLGARTTPPDAVVGAPRQIGERRTAMLASAVQAAELFAIDAPASPLQAERVTLLEQMAQGAALADILLAVVQFVQSQFPQLICSVMLLDADGQSLRHGASTGLPQGLIERFDGTRIGPASGSCGTAVWRRETVVVSDIANDPLWEPWRDLALQAGLHACWSMPIFSASDAVIGTFANYYRSPRAPSPQEHELVVHCARITGIAIERDRAQQQLMLLETSVAHLGDLVVITEALPIDEPGPRIVFVNEAFLRHTGYSREQVLGRSPRMLQGPLTSRAELDRIRAALEAVQPVRAELINYSRQGDAFWLELDITPVTDRQGRLTHYVSVQRDISAHKRIESAMRESEERFRVVAKVATDAIWDWNLRTDEVWWSEGIHVLFGDASGDRLSGESWTHRIHPDDRPRALEIMRAVIRGSEHSWLVEYRFMRSNGSYADALDRGFAIQDVEGRTVRMLGAINDVTQRRQADADALRASQTQELILRTQREVAESELALPDLMQLIASRAQQLTGAIGAGILFPEDDALVYRAVAGSNAPHVGLAVGLEKSLVGLTWRSRQVQLCNDTHIDARIDQHAARAVGARSALCAPLVAHNHVRAVFAVISDRPDAFTDKDAANLQILAESLAALLERQRNAEQLRASEENYRMLFDANPHAMWVYDPDTLGFLAVNSAAIEKYGYSRDELLAMTLHDLRPEQDVARLVDDIRRFGSGKNNASQWQHRRKDGTLLDVEVSADDILFESRRARLVMVIDITNRVTVEAELARISRARLMLSRCNGALLRAEDEQALLDAVCRIGVETGRYRMAWVGYAMDDASLSIRPAAAAGSGTDYLDGITFSWSAERQEGRGPAGRVLRTGTPVVIEYVVQNEAFSPWVHAAVAHGFLGVMCLPLREGDRAFGLLTFYAAEVQPVRKDELSLLQELADNLAFGIVHMRANAERQRMQRAVAKVATAVSSGNGQLFFDEMVFAMADAVAADAAFVVRIGAAQPAQGSIVAGLVDGVLQTPFDYPLEGTLGEHYADGNVHVIGDDLYEQFPRLPRAFLEDARACICRRLDDAGGRSLGLLCVLYREPLRKSEFIVSTLSIFAIRAASELERQAADAQLRYHASLLDRTSDAIIVGDLNHRIIYWNKGAEHLYGWTAEERLGVSRIEDVYREPALARTILAELLRDGAWNGRIAQQRRDGTAITVEARCTLIRDDQGAPRSFLAIVTDVTQRLAMEERMQRSERLESIGQLTGGIAHDFNNLLTVMMGNAEMLAELLVDQPRLQLLASMTQTAAERGAELTHRLLAFARRQALEPKAVQVNQLIASMQDFLRRTLGGQIDIRLVQAPDLWDALVDPVQLENAVLNLCINARDAMGEGGQLAIETCNVDLDSSFGDIEEDVQPGRYVLVAVSDSGVGIAPDDIKRVFEPFYTTKEFGKGTGLGLSMVYGFVKQSRGHIRIYSELGFGTTIKMYLPHAGLLSPAPLSEVIKTPALTGSGTILLVEDDDLVRSYVEGQLLDLGYEVIATRIGADALDILLQQNVDLLFTDVIMPGGMNGRQLADAALDLRPGLRVLYTSGYTENTIMGHGHLDNGMHLLNKPYSRAELASKVRAAMGLGASDTPPSG
jgi:PAS domain S-box-containing protein